MIERLINMAMSLLKLNKWSLVRMDLQGIICECDAIDTYRLYLWVVGFDDPVIIEPDGHIYRREAKK